MENLTIRIYEATEGGYMYDIYDKDLTEYDEGAEPESIDGGQCTTTMLNALGMATSQAEDIIKRKLS